MGPGRLPFGQFVLVAIACFAVGQAGAVEPELKTIQPLGCPRGAATEVTLFGDGFEQGGQLYFSRTGITSEHIEKNRYRVTVSGTSTLGDCDLWVATPGGLAGPRRFVVSRIPVSLEQSGNDSMDAAQSISVPGIVDARFDAADLDWFSFSGQAGQLVTISCRSKSLDGTAQPVITLFGPSGRERAHSPAYRAEPELHYRLPDSGSYRLLIRDRAYRNDDFSGYRLSIATGPRVVQVLPHVVDARDTSSLNDTRRVTLLGLELPGGKAYRENRLLLAWTVDACELERSPRQNTCFLSPAAYMLEGSRFRHPSLSGDVLLGLSSEPVVSEIEDDLSGPQRIALPCRIAGQFQMPGDVDWFRFSAKKDDVLQFEAFGERLDQWMDLEIAIRQTGGKQLTVLRDLATPKGIPAKLPLASLDAAGSWKVPADGLYDLVIRDLYGGSVFGPDRIYQLVIRGSAPAFHVVAMTASEQLSRGTTVARNGSAELQLIAIRSGGFAGPIHVRAEQPAQGVSIETCTISPKEVTKAIKISATPNCPVGIRSLRLVAEAEIGSDKQVVPVRSAALVRTGVTRNTDGTVIQVLGQGLGRDQ